QPAPGLDGCIDDVLCRLGIRDGVIVGHRLAAGRLDLLDDRVRHGMLAATAVDRTAGIVHHDLGAAARQQHGVRAAEAGTGAGDNGDAVVEADGHGRVPFWSDGVSGGILLPSNPMRPPMSYLRSGIFLAPFHNLTENPTLALERDMELLQHIDRLNYHEAWIGEHHSGGFEIIGSPEVFIAAAAERTRHIRLGTGVASLPYHNPFILADR